MANDYRKDIEELAKKQSQTKELRELATGGKNEECDNCGKHFIGNEKSYFLKYDDLVVYFCSKTCLDEEVNELRKKGATLILGTVEFKEKSKP